MKLIAGFSPTAQGHSGHQKVILKNFKNTSIFVGKFFGNVTARFGKIHSKWVSDFLYTKTSNKSFHREFWHPQTIRNGENLKTRLLLVKFTSKYTWARWARAFSLSLSLFFFSPTGVEWVLWLCVRDSRAGCWSQFRKQIFRIEKNDVASRAGNPSAWIFFRSLSKVNVNLK